MMRAGKKSEQAVLAAAVAWADGRRDSMVTGDEQLERQRKLDDAVAKYKETTQAIANLRGKEPDAAEMDFACPHCSAVRPSYGWNWNAGDTGAFFVAYLTCFCGECKNILSVAITTFTPAKEAAEAMMQQFKAMLAGKGVQA